MEETKIIINKLDQIKEELDYIKVHMIDPDTILTEDDLEALREAEEDFKKGRTKKVA